MLAGTAERARHEHSALDAYHQTAVDVQQLLTGFRAQLIPELVRSLKERHVHRMLEVHLPDDAAVAMGRSEFVPGHPSLEPEHFLPASRKMSCRSAAHRAKAGNDYVIMVCAVSHAFQQIGVQTQTVASCGLTVIQFWVIRFQTEELKTGKLVTQDPPPSGSDQLHLCEDFLYYRPPLHLGVGRSAKVYGNKSCTFSHVQHSADQHHCFVSESRYGVRRLDVSRG